MAVGGTFEYGGSTFSKEQAFIIKLESDNFGEGSCLTPGTDASISSLLSDESSTIVTRTSGSYSGLTSTSFTIGSFFSTPASWSFSTFTDASTSSVNSCAENVLSFDTFPATSVDYTLASA